MRTATTGPSDTDVRRGGTPPSETRTAVTTTSASKHSLRAMNHGHINHGHTHCRHAKKTAVQVVP